MSDKKPSVKLEEKLEKITFGQKAKSWNSFDEKQFEQDAKQVKNTFSKSDENILPKRNYF